MRLFYSPGACSLASHIILRETGADFSLEKVDIAKHKYNVNQDFYALTVKGQVPLLEVDQDTYISEGPIVMQYIADHMKATTLLPEVGSLSRIRVLEWCNYLTSEIHKSFTPIFHSYLDKESTDKLKNILKKKLSFVDSQLSGQMYISGNKFTIADAYLFVLLSWTKPIALDISDLNNLKSFQERVAVRPAVREAMKAEGLIS